MKKQLLQQKGFLLLGILVFAAISVLTIIAFVSWGITSNKLSKHVLAREQAFEVAEAGIEYSRWYLAHFQTGYNLGNSGSGPYTYLFKDKDGIAIGTYIVTVTPPPTGSTLVKITSKGTVYADSTATRTIAIQIAIPSLAKYAILSNSNIRVGIGSDVYGPLHSNGGVRMDGVAWNTVTSALSSYDDPDHTGGKEFGVHTHITPNTGNKDDTFRPLEAPPNPVPTRTDVFKAGRQFPVAAVDFTGMIADLANIKSQAQSAGKYFAASGGQGYLMVLKTNDTFDLYKVTSLVAPPSGCTNTNNDAGWSSWSVNGKTLIGNYAIPANGMIFTEDNLWVEGTIKSARLTVGAAKFPDDPNNRKSITINNNLLYTYKDGTDTIGLIAQNNVAIGMVSADTLEIDGALVAQNGRVGRFYYGSGCFPYNTRSQITLYGMIVTNGSYGFAFSDSTGYTNRIITYDPAILYGPPPNFPLATDNYQIISWEELES